MMVVKLMSFFLFFVPGFAAEAMPKPSVMAVIDTMPRGEFEEKRLSFLKEQLKPCTSCEVRNLTPYGEKGAPERARFGAAIERAAEEASFVFLPWNEKNGGEWAALVESMKKVAGKGTVILAYAGRPSQGNPPAMLSRTVMGQVPEVLIVGELSDRDRLVDNSFFGPELLTAVKPPKETTAKDVASDVFAAKLLMQWSKKSSAEWPAFLKSAKASSRRFWPALEDFFPR